MTTDEKVTELVTMAMNQGDNPDKEAFSIETDYMGVEVIHWSTKDEESCRKIIKQIHCFSDRLGYDSLVDEAYLYIKEVFGSEI